MSNSSADKIRAWIAGRDRYHFPQHAKALAALEIAVDGLEPVTRRKPVKPDYWNTCHQCEYDGDDAKEKLAEILKKLEE